MGDGRHTPGHGRWLIGLAVALATGLAVLAAACGGGDDEASVTEPAPAATSAASSTAPAASTESDADESAAGTTAASVEENAQEEGITDYVAYTGGAAGPADSSLPPVKIGWVNNQGGGVAPLGETSTEAAEWAVQYINEELGGIGGRPLELVECFVKNAEEEGLSCGQQFLNDPDISLAAFGAVSVGATTIESTIAGKKPLVLTFSVNPSDVTAENTYILFGAGAFTVYGWGSFAREYLDAETAAILYPEGPGLQEVAQGIKQATEAAGIETTIVGFQTGSTDLTGALTAAKAQTADMIAPMIVEQDCVAFERGLEQLEIDPGKVVSLPQCTNPSLKEAFGGDFPKWIYGIAQSGDALESPPRLAGVAFRDALAAYGIEDKATDPWYPAVFSQILTIAQVLNRIGPDNITPEAVAGELQQFRGPLLMGGPTIECGKYSSAPAVCADGDHFFQYEGDGVFRRISGWFQPPPELQEQLGANTEG